MKNIKNKLILKYCSLQQALEYMIFAREPVDYIHDKERASVDNVLNEKYAEYRLRLRNLIEDGLLQVKGIRGEIEIFDTPKDNHYVKIKLNDGKVINYPYNDFYEYDNPENVYRTKYPVEKIFETKGKNIDRAIIKANEIASCDFDWVGNIIAPNLDFAEDVWGDEILVKTIGYGFVVVDFEKLQSLVKSEYKPTTARDREKIIHKIAIRLIKKEMNFAEAVEIIEQDLKTGNSRLTRGCSRTNIRRALETVVFPDGKAYLKKMNRGPKAYGKKNDEKICADIAKNIPKYSYKTENYKK